MEAIVKITKNREAETGEVQHPLLQNRETPVLPKLSPRELQVLQLSANGHHMKEVADLLHISFSTADTHSRSVITKLGARNMKHAIAIGFRGKILT